MRVCSGERTEAHDVSTPTSSSPVLHASSVTSFVSLPRYPRALFEMIVLRGGALDRGVGLRSHLVLTSPRFPMEASLAAHVFQQRCGESASALGSLARRIFVNWVCVCGLSLAYPVWWIRVRSREFRSQRVYPDSANSAAQLGYQDIGYILLAHGLGSNTRSVRG